jgi:glycosyltransferase involved in cell wall biosynthesis
MLNPAVPKDSASSLISCIMPTHGRPFFVVQAIRCFLRQEYPNTELVVVDDGAVASTSSLTSHERVRYLRIAAGMSLGEKRNFGAEQARGCILAQWDDDDWFSPRRLSEQVRPILEHEAGITGFQTQSVLDLEEGGAWRLDAGFDRLLFNAEANPRTLMFERRVWEDLGGYPNLSEGEDSAFLARALDRGERLKVLKAGGDFIYIRHRDNLRRFVCGHASGWHAVPLPDLPEEDRELYAALRENLSAGAGSVLPLVTCIMPTADRRPLARQSIQRFLEQDYPHRELIVLDDGEDPIADLIPPDPRIRYIRMSGRSMVGAKRNFACGEAHGQFIAHWDDDDWMAPWRLSYQVSRLTETGAAVCGLDRMYFWEPVQDLLWEYAYPAGERPWVAGGTMMYRKSFWEGNPFPNVAVGEDNLFVWSAPPEQVLRLSDRRYYVATVHARNTSPKLITCDRWYPRPAAELEEVMGGAKEEYAEPFRAADRAAKTQTVQYAPVAARVGRRVLTRVSCVMATAQRPRFVRQAIRCFLRQTHHNAELIVVDDGTPGVEDLCSGIRSVRYLRAPVGTSLGAKLNLGVEKAQGPIVQKIDDDDYYCPEFLECAVSSLEGLEPGRAVVAWDCFLVLLAGERKIRFSGHGWAAGGSLCFHRELWRKTPFRDLPSAVDAGFLTDSKAEIRRVCAAHLYLVVRHGRNTWTSMDARRTVDDGFRQAPDSGVNVRQLVEPIDYPFYEALMRGEVAYE